MGNKIMAALFILGGCSAAADPEESASSTEAINVTNPLIPVRAGGNYWIATDGGMNDETLASGELDFALAGLPHGWCVVAAHGSPSTVENLPPAGWAAGRNCDRYLLNICSAGFNAPSDISVAQAFVQQQGIPCDRVVACQGTISAHPSPSGGTQVTCNGTFVNGCQPAVAINPPPLPGVTFVAVPFQTDPTLPANPSARTVGCFAGDRPEDVWRRCRDSYLGHRPNGSLWSCQSYWSNPDPGSTNFQTCQSLVRACIQATQSACLLNAAAPAPAPAPAAALVPAAPAAAQAQIQ